MPDVDLTNRHPACARFFKGAKLRSRGEKAAYLFVSGHPRAQPNTRLIPR